MKIILAILLFFPTYAMADEVVEAIQIAATIALVIYGSAWSVPYRVAAMLIAMAAGAYGAGVKQRKMEEEARQAYNAKLEDRLATRISSEAPHVYVYGRARIGSCIVAMFHSGDRDQYKYLVCIHAAHECEAIEEIYVLGKALGTLTSPDANGCQEVTSGDYITLSTTSVNDEYHSAASFNLSYTPIANSVRVIDSFGGYVAINPYTSSAITITSGLAGDYYCHYERQNNTPRVRITKHLGASGQVADPSLIAEIEDNKWTVNHKLNGYCYTVIRLDLNQQEFQGGIPSIEVLLKGKKVYDPRSSTTVWSNNPALAIRDYLISPMCNVSSADISDIPGSLIDDMLTPIDEWLDIDSIGGIASASIFTAANVCDETRLTGCTYSQTLTTVTVTKTSHGRANSSWVDVEVTSGLGITGNYQITSITSETFTYESTVSQTTSGNMIVDGLYTINGIVGSDQPQSGVLEKMAQAMAGFIVPTTWEITAGKYIAPVMSLVQSDIVGTFSITAGASDSDLYNGVKGQFSSAQNGYVPTDFKPYQNAVYRAYDLKDLYSSIDMPFTNTKQRVWNLARIFTEDQRNGYTVHGQFSLKAWPLRVGERVTLTSAVFGWTSKVFRVEKKSFSPTSTVDLTLKEDIASIWDLNDAVTLDDTPNTNLPNPWYVGLCGEVQKTEQIYETTGSAGVKVKVILTWLPPSTNIGLDYELEYKSYTSGIWIELFVGSSNMAEIIDLAPGYYDFRVKARNSLGAVGQYNTIKQYKVDGLTAIPSDVTGFSVRPMAGMALASWNRTTDLDVKIGGDVILRYSPALTGATWSGSVILPDGENNGDATNALVSLATGTYFAKFKDSNGNYSANPASFVVTEAIFSGWTTVSTQTEHTAFSGTKTNCVVDAGTLKLIGITLIDDMLTPIDEWEYIDNLGGITSSGEYLFYFAGVGYVDLTTSITRRYHVNIAVTSALVTDLIAARGLVSTWASVTGEVINGNNATVYCSTSEDLATWSGWSSFIVADYKARYSKFKMALSNVKSDSNIAVSTLTVTIKTLTSI